MTSVADTILKLIQDSPCPASVLYCVDPGKHDKLQHLVGRYLDRFSSCTQSQSKATIFSCSPKDGTPSKMLSLKITPFDFKISTGPLVQGPIDLDKPLSAEDSIYCRTSSGFSFSCFWRSKDNYSYDLTGDKSGCTEYYDIPPTDSRNHYQFPTSNCDNGYHLFDHFQKRSKWQKIATLSSAWSYAKVVAGIACAIFCGHKAYKNIQIVRDKSKPKPQEQPADRTIEKSSAIVETPAQKKAAIETAKKHARIYGIAAVSFLALTAYTYYTDFVFGVSVDGCTSRTGRF